MIDNPFGFSQHFFEVDIEHSETGEKDIRTVSITCPVKTTTVQVRRTLMDMGFKAGWIFRRITKIIPPGISSQT